MRGRLVPLLVAGIVTSAAVTAVLLLWVGVRRGVQTGQPPYVPAATTAVYVGRQACAECHTRENDLWQGSHHDLAMQPAGPDTVLGNFDGASFTHQGVTSTFSKRDGGFFVETDGPDGDLYEYRITHTFGVTPLQQYLIEFPGGRYQVLPLCWDTRPAGEGGRRWFHLYPDEVIGHGDALHWTGPNQNWNFMCAECHSTNLQRNYDLQRNSYDTTWSEIDVSCEACHGPGSRHVEWSRSGHASDGTRGDGTTMGLLVGLRDTDGGGWVMDMSTGTAKRSVPRSSRTQVETCARCHSRRIPIVDDDIPGQPFLDTHVPALLEEGLYHADGQILEEVYVHGSFLQSRMYSQGVTCSDCHDPHSGRLVARGNAVCGKCHLPDRYDRPSHHFHEPDGPASSCVECHMRHRTYMVVDPRRDHSFRIPRPDLSITLGTPNACNQCHTDRSPEWAADTVIQWYGPRQPHFGDALHAGRIGAVGAAVRLAAVATDTSRPAIARASALSLLVDSAGPASDATLAAIEAGLGDDDALVRLAAVDALADSDPEQRLRLAAPLLDDPIRAVRIRAARTLAAVAVDVIDPHLREALERAMAEYVQSELTNAERPESHVNLGNFYAEQRRFGLAETSYRTALRLDAAHVPAYVNLADVHRARGRDDQAEPLLRRAVEIAPPNAAAHHSLGLLLVRQGQAPQAIEWLRRAVELAPGNPRFAYVYAVSLHSAGRPADALRELERTHALHPADRDVLTALIMYHRQAGTLEAAIRFAEKLVEAAPDDPAGAQLLEELRD